MTPRWAVALVALVVGFALAHLIDFVQSRRGMRLAPSSAEQQSGRRPPRQMRRAQARRWAKNLSRQVYNT